jgi:hypothetical protein
MRTVFSTVLVSFYLLSLNGCALLPLEPASDLARDPASDEAAEQARIARARAVSFGRQNRDVVLGMDMRDVLGVWGEPTDIERAGLPEHGNERWIYSTGLQSRWSLREARVVYFEAGRVVGWETR